MSLDLIGKILIKTEVVTNDQWQAAVKASNKLDGAIGHLRKTPAWWHSQSPALSTYQMERIRYRAEHGLRDLDRDLRVGRYLKLQRLGKGGMAEVFKGWSLDQREVVALKLLLGEGSVLRTRQRREADALKKLNHPNIARFRAFDEPTSQESVGILAMEFVPGADVKETVEVGGTNFSLQTQSDNAWGRSAADDGRVVEAMRRGSDMLVKGMSARGTQSTDRYALRGLSQALDRVDQECR